MPRKRKPKPDPNKKRIVRYRRPETAALPAPEPKEPPVAFFDVQGAVVQEGDMPMPADRIFRDAWMLGSDAVVVDMAQAREIWRETLRRERAPRLQQLDVQFMRAMERLDQAAIEKIKRDKNLLRDVTDDPRIDAAATPDALKALTLDALLT